MVLAFCIGSLAAAIALTYIACRLEDPKMQLLSLLMGRSFSSKRPRHKHVHVGGHL